MFLSDYFESTNKDFRVERVANGYIISVSGYVDKDAWTSETKFVVVSKHEVITLFDEFLEKARKDD
mgnify:FL=1